MSAHLEICPVSPRDGAAVGRVQAAAFGRSDEAELVERLRCDGDVLVELTARSAGEIVGHVVFSRLKLSGLSQAVAALAPVAVIPQRQRGGMGSRLIREGLARCRDLGAPAVVVLGSPDYYPRFGFSAEAAARLDAPFSGPAFMALALTPGALAEPRTVTYARGFRLTR